MHDAFMAGYLTGVGLMLLVAMYVLYQREIHAFGKRWLAHELQFLREYQEAA